MGSDIHIALVEGSKCPCYKCDDRYPACHSYCEKYLAYRKILDDVNERVRLDKKLANDLFLSSRNGKKKGSQL